MDTLLRVLSATGDPTVWRSLREAGVPQTALAQDASSAAAAGQAGDGGGGGEHSAEANAMWRQWGKSQTGGGGSTAAAAMRRRLDEHAERQRLASEENDKDMARMAREEEEEERYAMGHGTFGGEEKDMGDDDFGENDFSAGDASLSGGGTPFTGVEGPSASPPPAGLGSSGREADGFGLCWP